MPSKAKKTKSPPKDSKRMPKDEELKKYTLEHKEEEKAEEEEIKEEAVPEKSQSPWKYFFLFLSVASIIGGVAGSFVIYTQGLKNLNAPSSEPAVVETPTPQPVASPALELKKSDLNLEVLNGSGTPGVANEARTFLENLGYSVGNTGNAAAFNFKETIISIKESKKDYLETLIKDLSEKYSVASESSTLEEINTYDAIITVGSLTS